MIMIVIMIVSMMMMIHDTDIGNRGDYGDNVYDEDYA